MSARIDAHIERLKGRGDALPIAWEAVELIGRCEDCRQAAYWCPAGVPSIGWGETSGVTLGMHWTLDQCDARFAQQLRRYAAKVEALCSVDPNENQLGAMTSLAYNIGPAAFAKSTVLRKHNEGDFDSAARAFGLWNKARVNGALTALRGLTLRRAAESTLYLTSVGDAPSERMPQAVEAESPLSASPIARGGAATVAAGAITGGATLVDQLGDATGTLGAVKAFGAQVGEFIGLPPGAILAVVLIGLGYVVVKWRREQRKQGFA